jgi:isochorismate synthase
MEATPLRAISAIAPSEVLEEFDPSDTLLFGSGDRLLLARGVHARLTQPATGGSDPGGEFQRAIHLAFASARAAGIERPIVAGSVPFDVTRPSALIIPKTYQWRRLVGQPGAVPAAKAVPVVASTGRQEFQDAVRELLALFRAGPVAKVVLSRVLEVGLPDGAHWQRILPALLGGSAAHRFAVPVGSQGCLVGASPELLLRRSGARVESNPLAGSAILARFPDAETAARHLTGSAKDLHEHRLVTEEVRRVLAPLCDDLHVPAAPSLLRLPTLMHLSSQITGRLRDPERNALALALALHPTPAVCGHPREPAREAIRRMEGFDRDLFCGITGWMNEEGDGEWAVTIRCGLVERDRLRVFAGAGIVEGSVPEHEWAETAAKLGPMLAAFGLEVGGDAS